MSTLSITPTSTDPSNQDPEVTPGYAPAFNFFFLLILVVGILIFSSLIYFSRRRLKRNNARLERTGHDAVARRVQSWPGRNRVRVFRPAYQSPEYVRRFQFSAVNPQRSKSNGIVDEEAALGLDERGEAPPPYRADKPPPIISRAGLVQPEAETGMWTGTVDRGGDGGQNVTLHRPPDYDQVMGLEDGMGVLTRPAAAVMQMERVTDVTSYGQGHQRELAQARAVVSDAR